ncbi:MAG: heme NO-binding domain-containing protein [Paracoccaceae bacterium]
MHGLINWSIQRFVCETYGQSDWDQIARDARIDSAGFEALMTYEDHITFDVIAAASKHLEKPQDTFLVDLGIFLCSHPNLEAVRRLLRFGGETFSDFLCSMDDLADRVHLALPNLEIPTIDLRLTTPGNVTMRCSSDHTGFGHVMVGILQAMADDYGMLALIEHMGRNQRIDTISIQMLSASFADGRNFNLSANAG